MKKITAFFVGFFLIFFSIHAEDFREGEVLVELKFSEIPASGIQTKSFIKTLKTNDSNIKVKSIFSHRKKQIFLVKSDIYSTQELIGKMKKNPYVYRVEPNYIIKPLVFPNDSEYADNDYSRFWGLDKIQAFDAWDITTGSNDVVIAVIDTGIDYTHPDLADNIWRNEIECSGIDNEDDDGNGYIDDCIGYDMHDGDNDPVDYDGHGTHVAGIIGAVGNNNLGISGVNWRVKLLPCKIFDNDGGGSYVLSAAIECLNYIVKLKEERGVNIVASNNSWAASPGVYLGDILKDAIQESVNAGILFITAAGNEGSNNDKTCISDPYCQHVYPCDYELDNDGIICVTATDQNDELPWYANYGVNSVDIAAPGDAIYSTTTTQETFFTLSAGHYKYESGTSMAAPFVAGAVGLLKSKYPDLNWKDVKASILMNGDVLPSLQNHILTESRLNLLSMLTNPIKDVSENMGISLAESGTIQIYFPEKSFSIENPGYTFVEDPVSLDISLDNESTANVKFYFISFDYGLKPAVCYDNDGKCHVMDNDVYLISTQDLKPYISIYIEDNGIYDADNETGKIHLNVAFVKLKNIDDNESQSSSSGGGCSLSNRNDISLMFLFILVPIFFLGKRFLFQGD